MDLGRELHSASLHDQPFGLPDRARMPNSWRLAKARL
jgi:hypothetical protein